MNDDVVEAITVDITDRGPAANVFINDHMFEIHSSSGAGDKDNQADYHWF
jgi:hypothetical protein